MTEGEKVYIIHNKRICIKIFLSYKGKRRFDSKKLIDQPTSYYIYSKNQSVNDMPNSAVQERKAELLTEEGQMLHMLKTLTCGKVTLSVSINFQLGESRQIALYIMY